MLAKCKSLSKTVFVVSFKPDLAPRLDEFVIKAGDLLALPYSTVKGKSFHPLKYVCLTMHTDFLLDGQAELV